MKNGMNQDGVQKINRILIVRLLREAGSCSRADLARMSGLRPATITNIVNELKHIRLIREEGSINAGRGRNGVAISLDTSYYRVVGVRVSRKYFLVGLFDIVGNELESSRYEFAEDETPKERFERIREQIGAILKRVKEEKVVAIGIAIPGPFFRNHDSQEKGFEFQDWPEISIERLLKERFGVYVFVEHDANAGALGSYWQMNVGQEKMLVYFSAGQGIGAGFVNGGKLILGALGVAGEIGHMTVETNGILCKCGNYGCLEMYCSSTVLVNRVNKKLTKGNYSILKEGCDLEKIGNAARAGDKLTVAEYERECSYLGVGVVNIMNILNPDIVVIGDELARILPETMKECVLKVVQDRMNPIVREHTDIYIVGDKEDLSLKGAAIVAIEGLLDEPIAFEWAEEQ